MISFISERTYSRLKSSEYTSLDKLRAVYSDLQRDGRLMKLRALDSAVREIIRLSDRADKPTWSREVLLPLEELPMALARGVEKENWLGLHTTVGPLLFRMKREMWRNKHGLTLIPPPTPILINEAALPYMPMRTTP